ncbi:MAG TPA: tRNA-(ms[2]io[6]A)-hydroxylase [Thermoanaerobaculia bacterium]|nr:tRNA-(ms[2]io[6]A)-hydroxylase [Thermoanaerobaculia bacterium]
MRLRTPTPPGWAEAVRADLDAFLRDHAANERKASASALSFVSHYPDRPELVARCIALAREELEHFERVVALMAGRGLRLGPDAKSAYLRGLSAQFREGSDEYFLDRLLTSAIAEARGCERFGLLGAALPQGEMREFYRELARTEARHHETYRELARTYFPAGAVERRLGELLDAEAGIVESLPLRSALY